MPRIENETMLSDFAKAEANSPSPRKIINDSRNVYKIHRFRSPKSYGFRMLFDFGAARIGKVHDTGPFVQPHIYRASEIIFEMPWGSEVDIWNSGCLIWDLFEGTHPFNDTFDTNGGHDPFRHLALMTALLRPPFSEFRNEVRRRSNVLVPAAPGLSMKKHPFRQFC